MTLRTEDDLGKSRGLDGDNIVDMDQHHSMNC